MTEGEWLECGDPTPMLEFLRGKASERKLRLLACAYSRRAWGILRNIRSKEANEVAERYADGQAGEEERHLAMNLANAVQRALHERYRIRTIQQALWDRVWHRTILDLQEEFQSSRVIEIACAVWRTCLPSQA